MDDREQKTTDRYNEGTFKNITHEYLQNTWGLIESKEHAEFIVELAELHGFEFVAKLSGKAKYFRINESYVGFYETEIGALHIGFQKITIPLPPKQIQTATPEDEFEMTQIIKNAGDNLILGCEDGVENLCDRVAESILKKNHIRLGCEDSKCDKWIPQVGDEVVAYDIGFEREMTMIYRGKNKNNASIVEFENGNVILLGFEGKIKKPKTPEEELRDEIKKEVFSSFAIMPELFARRDVVISISECVASELARKYNITKKPQ